MINSNRIQVETEEEWNKWSDEIPSINFPSEFSVQIIPPSTGAIVRFVVTCDTARVSVYLDCYDNLATFGEPYWEMYPYMDGDVARFRMADVDELMVNVKESVNNQLMRGSEFYRDDH